MTVACPDCRSIFRVDPAKVPATGVRARCSVCGGILLVSGGTAPIRTPARTPVPALGPTVTPSEAPAGVPLTGGPALPAPFSTPLASRSVPPVVAPPAPRTPAPLPFRPAATREAAGTPSSSLGAITPRMATPSAAPGGLARLTPREPAIATRATPHTAPTPVAPTPVASVPVAPTPVAPTPVAPTPVASGPATPTPVSPTAGPLTGTPAVQSGALVPAAALGVTVAAASPTPASATAGARRPINPFLNADPGQRARRLARALVSDLVAYNPRKREEGIAQGTLRQLFREDIKKSYEEYVEQVGKELAESSPYFQEALNDILAGGQRLF